MTRTVRLLILASAMIAQPMAEASARTVVHAPHGGAKARPALAALLIWTGPHTPCVWARPDEGDPADSAFQIENLKAGFSVGAGLLEQGPDRQSATVCALPVGERVA